MKKIICTVGTSLFSNFQQEEVKNKYGRDYASIAIDRALKAITDRRPIAADIYEVAYKHYIELIQENIQDYWFGDKFPDNRKASAEIASIIAIVDELQDEQVEVHLLATDTLLSVLAAELIRDWFSEHKQLIPKLGSVVFQRAPVKFDAQRESDYVVKDLRVNAQEDYQEGFMNLIELLERISKKNETILNITGGYKAIIPIMTIYGQLYEIPLMYLHDSEGQQGEKNELVFIGNLPVNFDFSLGELYLDYITKEGLRNISSYPDILSYLRQISLVSQNGYKLTPLGRLFRDYIQPVKDKNKGELGHVIELRLMKHFVELGYFSQVKLGQVYWWDRTGKNAYTLVPQYGKDADKEWPIEIDLILLQNDGSEEWIEIKSWSKTGLEKAKVQLKKRIAFWQSTSVKQPSHFTLLLYKLPSTTLNHEVDQIRAIESLFLNEPCVFTVKYLDLPISNKGLVNIKALCENELNICEYEITEQYG